MAKMGGLPMTAEMIKMTSAPTAPTVPMTPGDILNRAVAEGKIDLVERLIPLYERWEKSQARKEFEAGLAAASIEIVPVIKNRTVDFTSPKGRTNYKYEDFAAVDRAVRPILAKHGISFRFRTHNPPNEPITVTCVVFGHGHIEENSLSAGRDETGNKNSIQAIGSTVTYLQRYTLKAALGLAASNDDDGHAAGGAATGPISEEQLETIQSLIVETGSDIPKFCKVFKIGNVKDLAASDYQNAVDKLNTKKAKQEAKS
jgi:hypothetical protein